MGGCSVCREDLGCKLAPEHLQGSLGEEKGTSEPGSLPALDGMPTHQVRLRHLP